MSIKSVLRLFSSKGNWDNVMVAHREPWPYGEIYVLCCHGFDLHLAGVSSFHTLISSSALHILKVKQTSHSTLRLSRAAEHKDDTF